MLKEPERNQRKALGKGLSALLPSRAPAAAPAPETTASASLPEKFEQFLSIPLHQIRTSQEQPRSSFDGEKMDELARSIRINGLLQPISVYRSGPDEYTLIAGERRWRASQIAGLKEIPALVRNAEQQERLELALIENIQREDLNAIEIATAFQTLATDHGLSHEEIAERTGKERSTVTNFLRLLRLSSPIQSALISQHLSVGHARALLNLDEPTQIAFYRRIQNEGLSVRETERLVKEHLAPESLPFKESKSRIEQPAPSIADANVRAAVDEMASVLGTKVRLHERENGQGRIEIEYYSADDLDRIYALIVDSPK